MKSDTQEQKGNLSLTPTERNAVAENHQATQVAPILGLTEEEAGFAIQYAAGPHMGNQQKSYKAAFPTVTDNYASSRSSDLMKRERVVSYIKMISLTLIERLIVENGSVERLEDWRNDAAEAKAILRAARKRQIRLTSVESANLMYVINRALGTPVQIADVTHRDESATIQALSRYAMRVQEERRQREEPIKRVGT
jgi:hypothetical protein